jgi:hypothetical protein
MSPDVRLREKLDTRGKASAFASCRNTCVNRDLKPLGLTQAAAQRPGDVHRVNELVQQPNQSDAASPS